MKLLFDYLDYKDYLNAFIKSKPGKGHGFKTQIADAIQCRSAFVSQVLNGEAQFSLEQGERLNNLLEHTEEESDFFLQLVQLGRAGSYDLKLRIKNQINKVLEGRQILKKRLVAEKTLDLNDQTIYYSHWYYSAIHIFISIEGKGTKDKIKEYFNLPTEIITDVLDFLTRTKLILYNNGKYSIGTNKLFLGTDSPLITKHHTNWRILSIQSLDKSLKSDLHYSGVVSINHKDLAKIKEEYIKGIEAASKIISDSTPEDSLYSICIDFFKI